MTPEDKALTRQVESIGRAPGSIVAPPGAPKPRINVILFDKDRHEARKEVPVESLGDVVMDGRTAWVDITGLGDQAVLEALIQTFDIPWLAMEDVLHSPQRPKLDVYDDSRFIVLRMFDTPGTCDLDQFSIFVRGNIVLTFQERPGDPFDGLRKRIAHKDSQIRQRGPDYFVYRLVDACVDSIFPELQRLADGVDAIEELAIQRPTERIIRDLHALRRDLRILERVAVGTRDAIAHLMRNEDRFFQPETLPYLHDVYDHATQVVELAHYYTSVANDIGSLVIGTLDLRMNQIMKILAAVTVVFMPLTLIAGIYGMNFDVMPELRHRYGYFGALGVMLVIGVALWIWMRRLGWTRSDVDDRLPAGRKD